MNFNIIIYLTLILLLLEETKVISPGKLAIGLVKHSICFDLLDIPASFTEITV